MERFFTDNEEWTREARNLHFVLKQEAEDIVRDHPGYNLRELLYVMHSAATDVIHSEIIRRRLSPPCPKSPKVESPKS